MDKKEIKEAIKELEPVSIGFMVKGDELTAYLYCGSQKTFTSLAELKQWQYNSK